MATRGPATGQLRIPWAGPDGAVRMPAERNFALDILHEKAGEGKLDKDLLDVFVTKKIYLPAAAR